MPHWDKGVMERIRQIRRVDDKHNFTFGLPRFVGDRNLCPVGNQHYWLPSFR